MSCLFSDSEFSLVWSVKCCSHFTSFSTSFSVMVAVRLFTTSSIFSSSLEDIAVVLVARSVFFT